MKIIKVISVKYGEGRKYCLVTVQLEHGGYAEIFNGGEVEEYISKYDKPMAHIKWSNKKEVKDV